MDVVFECCGGPAAELLDGGDVDAVQVEGHGAASAKGVAADLARLVAHFPESDGSGCHSDGVIDALGCDWLRMREENWVVDCVDGCADGAAVGQDVVHPACESLDGARGQAGALLVDALSLASSLLPGDGDGCGGGLLQPFPGGFDGDDAILGVPESHIVHGERVGVAAVVGRG